MLIGCKRFTVKKLFTKDICYNYIDILWEGDGMKKIFVIFVLLLCVFIPSLVNAEDLGMINGDFVTIRATPSSKGKAITKLLYGTEVTILEEANDSFYKILYDGLNTAYVSKTYVWKYNDLMAENDEYCNELMAKGFPYSYCPYLNKIHADHPTWVFEPLQTGVDFDYAVDQEEGKNYIQSSNDAYKVGDEPMEAGTWYMAKQSVVAYFLDPRNFLTDKTLFMFENLGFDEETQTADVVRSIFGESSYLTTAVNEDNTSYVDYYMEAGRTYLVSPVHLAARTKQEGGSSSTYAAVTGTYNKEYNGRSVLGYYNYYSIGAYADKYTNSPVLRGLAYAACYVSAGSCNKYLRPWTSRKKAIYGGAEWIANGYIAKGQHTIYLEKFNVNPNANASMFTHQYMTNVLGAYVEGHFLSSSYKKNGLFETPFKFIIPVFNNMPDKSYIPSQLSTNNSLISLNINDKLIEGFDSDIEEYTIYLLNTVTSAKIDAVAASADAVVEGTGTFELPEEINTFTIKVTAENGDVCEYVITIKIVSDTTTVEDIVGKLSVKVKDKVFYGISTNTAVKTVLSSIEKISPNAKKKVLDSSGKEKTTGIIVSGDKVMIGTYTSPETTFTLVVTGDLNNDGLVTIKDLLKVQKHLLGTNKLEGNLFIAGDTNFDGKLTVVDLLRIQKHILGSITL